MNSTSLATQSKSDSPTRTWSTFASLQPGFTDNRKEMSQIRAAGHEALIRLLPVALRDSGQSIVVARFLLNLYNGYRFPFDLTDMRRLDHSLVVDCLTVLQMDCMLEREVHKYFENGAEIWEKMARDWGFRDFGAESWR